MAETSVHWVSRSPELSWFVDLAKLCVSNRETEAEAETEPDERGMEKDGERRGGSV